jgi:hypothetical protein
MSKITDQKHFLLQSIFRNKLSEKELILYANGSSIYTFDQEELLFSGQKKFFLIIKGDVLIKSENNDLVTRLSSGFVGLSYLFSDKLWQRYRAYSTSGLQVLHLDLLIMQDMMKKFPAFQEYFFRNATELDLVLLHHYSTETDISQRANLAAVVSSLEELSLDAGLYDAGIVKKDKNFLILHTGRFMHTSGPKLLPGKIYDCSALPDTGEWVNMGNTRLLYSSDPSNNLLNSNKAKLLDVPQEQTLKQVDSINTVNVSDTLHTSKAFKNKKRFNYKHYLPFVYIFLFLVSILAIIITSI